MPPPAPSRPEPGDDPAPELDDGGSSSDADLLAAHVAGDPGAFAQLVVRHRDRLWALALRTTGDREDASDALQDALVSAFRAAGGYRGDAAVTTWLHRIVVNACLDRLRRRRRHPTVPLPEAEPADSHDDHAATEVRLDVQAALAALPEHQRVALSLVDMQGLSVAEAARVLDVAEGTVKSRCARGRAALAVVLRPALDTARNPSPPRVVPPTSAGDRAPTTAGRGPAPLAPPGVTVHEPQGEGA